MPKIEITEDQRERLAAVQEALEADVVGKYGHVRPSDAVEYLLDRYEADADGDTESAADRAGASEPSGAAADGSTADDPSAADDSTADDGGSLPESGGDAALDAMMSLLDEYEDRWRRTSDGEARYEVDLPDGSTEGARTKDDVRGLLFKHYR